MPLIPIKLPPGVWRNGTRYQAAGRWFATNLCRWFNGALRPVGGWTEALDVDGVVIPDLVADPALEIVRDGHSWRANNKDGVIVWGSNLALYWQSESGALATITPAGLPAAPLTPTVEVGFGEGYFGLGPFGVERPLAGTEPDPVGRWIFDTWGENLLALADWDGVIYEWDVNQSVSPPAAIANAPTGLVGFVVTDQRQVMTIGALTEARLVQWCDTEDFTDWTSTSLNQAGSFVLPGDGALVGVYKVAKVNLILSETDAHTARYIGPPYVYRFDKVGEDCAPIHHAAVVATENMAVWLGRQSFWMFDGSAVRPLPSDLIDYLIEDLDVTQRSKITAWNNGDFTEVWWHYVSFDSPDGDVDKYVAYNWTDRTWHHGSLRRTAQIDRGVAPTVVMVDLDGKIWNHELDGVGFDEGVTAFASTGPLELGKGEYNMAVRWVHPDTPAVADVSVTFAARQFPTGDVRTFGPYAYANPMPVRVLGRDITMTVTGQSNDWELGDFRLDVAPQASGGRR